MHHAPCNRIGFTFVELVIVITVLVALMAIAIPVWSMVRSRAAIGSTHSLVSGVVAQIGTYSNNRLWTWQDPLAGTKSGPIFDLNRDGLIDGNPGVLASDLVDGGFPPEVLASGYRGFIAMTGMSVGKDLGKNQQPLDAWKRPLRIAFAAKIYGTAPFGVWSAGPDGVDGTADDLCSWPRSP